MSNSNETIQAKEYNLAGPAKFSDEFFSVKTGATEDFFPESVVRTLEEYGASPQNYSPEEELIILDKMRLGLSFEQPGVIDSAGAWKIADQLRLIAKSEEFPFVSELGRRFAHYVCVADQVGLGRSDANDDTHKMYAVGYSADKGGFGTVSAWGDQIKQYVYAEKARVNGGEIQEQHANALNSPTFQSFLAKELTYSTKDFGTNFPIELFVKFMEQQDPATFDKNVKIMHGLQENMRPIVAEAFLATEFGDDFGDIVLNLTERHGAEAMGIFVALDGIRQGGERIAKHFGQEGIDKMIGVAFIKRATELLALAESEGLNVVSEDMNVLHDTVRQIADAVDTETFTVMDVSTDHGTLRANNAPVTITGRPYGDNARLSMTVRHSDGQRVNIRLDYEFGYLSLDIGSLSKKGDRSLNKSLHLARSLARGELALANRRAKKGIEDGANRQQLTLHLNHVREAFSELGDTMPSQFAIYVNNFLYSLQLDEGTDQQKRAA